MNPEKDEPTITPEIDKKLADSVEKAIAKIDETEKFIAENTDTVGPEATELVDSALAYQAKEVVKDSDSDGVRTEAESSTIGESVKAVIVEGALEGSGTKTTSGENPIIDLEKSGLSSDVTSVISELHIEDAKLPTGENIAELAANTIEREQTEPIPETLYRGERVYLNNIDQIGQRDLSTVGHEQTHNQQGKVYLSRDIDYAINYAIGTDGVTWYDHPLAKEEIPIGVVYKIKNPNNIIGAIPEGEALPDFIGGELAGKHREFTADSVPAGQYQVAELQIMDDYIQPNGHRRSDMRDILERFTVNDPAKLSEAIQTVKKRIDELDADRITANI
jgi:hypothetical protein